MELATLIAKHGSVILFITATMEKTDIRKLRRPNRDPLPGDRVIGNATDAIKRLVGVYRTVKDLNASFEVELAGITAQLDGLFQRVNKEGQAGKLGPSIAAMQDPKLIARAGRHDVLKPKVDRGKLVQHLVRAMITTEIEYGYNVPKEVEAVVDSQWRIVTPAASKRGMPDGLAALVSGMTGEGYQVVGADTVFGPRSARRRSH